MKIANPIFCVVFLLSGCLFHRPAYYPMQVLMRNGVPFFSVANAHEARRSHPEISFINVYFVDGDSAFPLWRLIFPPDQPAMNISPQECLRYGMDDEDAAKLQQGFRYGISMNTYIDGNNRMYKAYFC